MWKLIVDRFPPFFLNPKKRVTDRQMDGWTDRLTAGPGKSNFGGFESCFGVISIWFWSFSVIFARWKKTHYEQMDGQMDRWTNGPTDRRTDRRTDQPSNRDAWTHLKIRFLKRARLFDSNMLVYILRHHTEFPAYLTPLRCLNSLLWIALLWIHHLFSHDMTWFFNCQK